MFHCCAVFLTLCLFITLTVHFAGNNAACGVAYTGGPTKAFMFSVSCYKCTTGYYSFGHEISHNLNALHDSGTMNSCATTAYNYGYRDHNAKFRSILAYGCVTGQCDNMTVVAGCPRVQRFSNPDFLYNGLPIGDITHNNARQINEKRALAAALYPAMNCHVDTDCNDNNTATVDTCNTANGCCVFT
jgi:hypothetical protein